MGVVRNKAGIVTDPDGRSWAVAVFTRADRTYERRAEVDGSIGEVAALAVASLRAAT
jgi:beta-lactamase class A